MHKINEFTTNYSFLFLDFERMLHFKQISYLLFDLLLENIVLEGFNDISIEDNLLLDCFLVDTNLLSFILQVLDNELH